MPPQATFYSVWYRDHRKGVLEFIIPFLTFAHMSKGSLDLQRGRIDFIGGGLRLHITKFRHVSFGKCGIDLIVNWVRVDYDDDLGEPCVAYFADGQAFGWSGVFGGTERLLGAIETIVLRPPRFEEDYLSDVDPGDGPEDVLDVQRLDVPGPPRIAPFRRPPRVDPSQQVAHRGPTILALGLLSFFMATAVGLILGPIAWIMGNRDLRAMDAGKMSEAGRGTTNIGRLLGIFAMVFQTMVLLGLGLCCTGNWLIHRWVTNNMTTMAPPPPPTPPPEWFAPPDVDQPLGSPVAAPAVLPEPPPDVPGKTTVDLIPLINPRRNTVYGKWLVFNRELHCSHQHLSPRIQIPYEPPEEYDFIVTFSQPKPRNGIGLIMPRPKAGSFYWSVGAEPWGYRLSSRPEMKGMGRGMVKPNTAYTTVVQVRRDRIRCLLDGRELVNLQTDFDDLTCDNWHHIPEKTWLGVSCDDPTVFHFLRVIEISGAGKKIVRDP